MLTKFSKYSVSFIVAMFMTVPIVCILFSGININFSVWTDLWKTRIPGLMASSLFLMLTVTAGSLLLGSLLAYLVERTDLPGRQIFKPLLVAPLIIPCYIIAICYTSFFGIRGLCERALELLNIHVHVPNIYGFWGAAGILILGTYPYVYTIVSAAISQLDPKLSEAAKSLGANRTARLFKVFIPLLIPALSAGGILTALYVLSDFGVVSLLRYSTFVNAIYEQLSSRYDYSIASVLSLNLVLITLIFLVLQEKLVGQKRFSTDQRKMDRLSRDKLGVVKVPAVIFVSCVVMVGLILPFGILVYWFIESFFAKAEVSIWASNLTTVLHSGFDSLLVSGITATLAVILSLPLAYLAIRNSQKHFGKGLLWLSQTGIALPGVLIALGLTIMMTRLAPKYTFSILTLTFALLIHFFAQGLQAVRSGLAQISEKLEEQSRLLGFSRLHTFWYITKPLLKPSLIMGWILVFLSSMRELPASLLLRPAGFDPLTVRVWIAASEGFYEQAAAPALMLITLSLPLIFIVLRQGEGKRQLVE